jgi:serine-type D-Ala-D-Ala carboxypeptidase (penicillin-binding protein 5/6)
VKGLLALGALCAAIAAGLAFAGAFGGGDDGARAPAPPRVAVRTVQQLPPPLPERGPSQTELGPLPAPAGAARVDLSQRSLLSFVHLRPAPKAGLAFDLADGRVLWRRAATRTRPIASLTKLMTALLAVERFGAHDRVRVPRAADWVAGSRMGGLKPGRRVRAEVLLKGLLISSGNDAATTLAIAGAGSERAWVRLMNTRAKLLGLGCTHYVDSHGLDRRNRSCPADLAVLAMRAMDEPRIRAIVRKPYARVWTGAGKKLTLRTTNHLLRDHYPGAIGLKTGFTSPAGFCLVAVVQRGAKRIGIVVLGSRDSFGAARRLARAAVRVGVLPKGA